MRAVLQRVEHSEVRVINKPDFDSKAVGQIQTGLLVLLGITHNDTKKEADKLIEKILKLRLFSDNGESAFEKNIEEINGSILVVSQFTLYADCKKGTRPSFSDAARPEKARELYDYLVQKLIDRQIHVETGEFGEHMEVELVNDGPVTIILDTDR